MADIKLTNTQYNPLQECVMDFLMTDVGQLDETEELATSVRVALGTDALADAGEVLPDPDSTDRRGWWGDYDAEEIWDGWPIGCRNWLLTRAKITESQSSEGATIERARLYTRQAVQAFLDRRVCSAVSVDVQRTELERIDATVVLYRGPLPAIDLRYQLLWGVDTNRRFID